MANTVNLIILTEYQKKLIANCWSRDFDCSETMRHLELQDSDDFSAYYSKVEEIHQQLDKEFEQWCLMNMKKAHSGI